MDFWTIAATEPSRLALIDPVGRRVSTGELLAGSRRLANGLGQLGLRPGSAVAAVLPNSAEAIQLYLAAAEAGWYLVPISAQLKAADIAHIVANSEATVLVAHERVGVACAEAASHLGLSPARCFGVGTIPGFTSIERLTSGQPATPPSHRTTGRVMHYTSGTTGWPKGVRRPLPGIAPEAVDWTRLLPLNGLGIMSDDVHLCCTPWYHAGPLTWISVSLHGGHGIVMMDRFWPEHALDRIQRHRVTHTLMVPTQFVFLLALPAETRQRYDLSSLRILAHGAAPCDPEVKRRMIDWVGPVVNEYYSSTEGGGTMVTTAEWLLRPGTVGRPWEGAEIAILDDGGNRVPPRQIGQVYIRSEEPFEYHKDPERTAGSRHSNYFTVGDVGYLDADGYLFLCGRQNDVISSGGENIYPDEIERVLLTHERVADAAAVGAPSRAWGQEVRAVVQLKPGVEPDGDLARAIVQFCRERLAPRKVPRSVDFVPELPRDQTGKLSRARLTAQPNLTE